VALKSDLVVPQTELTLRFKIKIGFQVLISGSHRVPKQIHKVRLGWFFEGSLTLGTLIV
jgi:hypothetical protein